MKGNAQTYTFDLARPGCDGQWTTVACWEKANNDSPPGCIPGISEIPNLTGSTGCGVFVTITDDVILPGNVTLGGTLAEIEVQNGAVFTFGGNVTIQANRAITFDTRTGGRIDVLGTSGIALSSGASTVLNINGDNTGSVTTPTINFANDVTVNVNPNGVLMVTGDTFVSGKEVELNISGFFRTTNFKITGNDTRLNVSNPGIVVVDRDFELTGQGGVVVGGSSEVEVGGDIKISGGGSDPTFEIDPTASFKVCGTATTNPTVPELIENQVVFGSCRILPVDYTHFEVVQSSNRASTLLKWTTAKEENNAYFEVERSLAGIQDFKVIGQVPGMGWTDTPSEYTFEDRSLPLAGGDVFYRLRQVDFDGKYSLSKVIKVRVQGVNSTRGIWRVHPNPVAGESPKLSLVEASAYTDGPIQIRLIHVSSVMQKAAMY